MNDGCAASTSRECAGSSSHDRKPSSAQPAAATARRGRLHSAAPPARRDQMVRETVLDYAGVLSRHVDFPQRGTVCIRPRNDWHAVRHHRLYPRPDRNRRTCARSKRRLTTAIQPRRPIMRACWELGRDADILQAGGTQCARSNHPGRTSCPNCQYIPTGR
jgi:hypothetical protein